MLTQNTEVEIEDFTTVPVRCLTWDFFSQIFNNCRMGCHSRLEPFKFLYSAHESVVRDPTKTKYEKMLVESR